MRTKTLLVAAAALAAGLATSMAQSSNVFSVNIVGYINTTLVGGGKFTLVSNPLNNGTNRLADLLPNVPNQTVVQVWNGSGFDLSTKAFGSWSTNLSVPPGTGFFVQTPAASGDLTNTFVGSVVIGSGGTNTVNLPAGSFVLSGSPVPFSGSLTDSGPNTLNLNSALANQSSIQKWNVSSQSFQLSTKAFGNWSTNLTLNVGEGFFIQSATATPWSQTLQ